MKLTGFPDPKVQKTLFYTKPYWKVWISIMVVRYYSILASEAIKAHASFSLDEGGWGSSLRSGKILGA